MIYIDLYCEEETTWVRSDENPVGIEREFVGYESEAERALSSLAEFFGYDPDTVLCFD